jgi:hypothetical protein
MQTNIAIVLTGTIIPNSILTIHTNSEIRKQEYLQAIQFYTQFATVYFLENSTYPVEQDNDFLAIENLLIRKMPVSLFHEKGKGYQEFEMIDRWLEQEQDPPLTWFKISGRYVFENFGDILAECLNERKHQLVIDQLFHHNFATTTIFWITTVYYLKHFKNIYKTCDDLAGEFIEIAIFKKLTENLDDPIRLFNHVRKITAISGSTGKKINNSGIIYTLKVIARRLNLLVSDRYILYPIKLSLAEFKQILAYCFKR